MSGAANPQPPLRGMGVLVTRPAHQAQRLCRLIEAQGGEAICFPTLEILAPQDLTATLKVIDQLDEYAMAIFVSANAVSRSLTLIRERRELPPHLQLLAIGRGTARELERWDRVAYRLPENTFTSEALLAIPDMHAVTGQRIVIFRGQGGRELLADTLRERGAYVTYAEVYRRGKPATLPDELLQRWARQEIQAVIITSNDSLLNLLNIVGERGRRYLSQTPLIVISERARQLAQQLGLNQVPLVAREASDEAIVEALLEMTPSPIRVTCGDS